MASASTPPQPWSSGTPVITDLPSRIAQLNRKYRGIGQSPEFTAAYQSATPQARGALQSLDTERVARGSQPYSSTESALGLTAATRGQPVTPEPEQGFWGDLTSNVGDLVKGIPRLPVALIEEATAVKDNLADLLPQALESGDGPLNTLGNIANLPGVRFAPGAFVLGAYGDAYTDPVTGQEITPEGTDTLVDNPLFTALDVLPYASKAAKMSRPYKRVADAQLAQARALGTQVRHSPRPIPTFLRNVGGRVDQVPDIRSAFIESGQTPARGFGAAMAPEYQTINGVKQLVSKPVAAPFITEGPLGRRLTSSTQSFGRTAPGQFLNRVRGPLSRTAAERSVYASSYISTFEQAQKNNFLAAETLHKTVPELDDLATAAGIDAARMSKIQDALVLDDTAVKSTFSPAEQVYVDRFQSVQDDLRAQALDRGNRWLDDYRMGRAKKKDMPADGLLEVQFPHGPEVYSVPAALDLLNRERKVSVGRYVADRLTQFQSGQRAPLSSLDTEVLHYLKDPQLDKSTRTQLVNLAIEDAARQGVDVAQFRADWNKANKNRLDRAYFTDQMDQGFYTLSNPTRPSLDPRALVDTTVQSLTRTKDPVLAKLRDRLKSEDWSGAKKQWTNYTARRGHDPTVAPPGFSDALVSLRTEQRIASKLESTASGVAKAEKDLMKARAKAVPARWDDLVRREARDKLVSEINSLRASGQLTIEQADRAIEAASRDLISSVELVDPQMVDVIANVTRDARRGWQLLADQGLDPRWVHRVTADQVSKIEQPRVFDNPAATPKQFRERLWDPSPAIPDLNISLAHQAYDLLSAQASKQFADEMVKWYGHTGSELRERFMPLAERAYQRSPDIPMDQHLSDLIRREFVEYDPTEFGLSGRPRRYNTADQVFLPKQVADTLRDMRPTTPSTLERAASAPMKVFRTSLLPLSPRWHLYNIVGGGVMAASTISVRSMRHIADAWRLARDQGHLLGQVDTPTAALPPGGAVRATQEWMRNANKSTRSRLAARHAFASGNTLGRILSEVWEHKATRATAERGSRIIQGSYDFNQFVDNFYRSLTYLDEVDKAKRSGLSTTESIEAGIDAARTALQSWDRLTPIERSGMKMLMPFYSWTRHLLGFVLQYPHDHPWRLSIMARIAETDISDHDTGLPARFASMFSPFGADADGNELGLFLDGANPFKDVTNWAMLGGFLMGQEGGNLGAITSSLNPLITIPLEQLGFDTFAGTPDLYPDLHYDPTTGEMTTSPRGNPLLNAVGGIIPQTEALANYLGWNDEFRELAERDPDAADRMLMGSLGIPAVFKSVNVPQEQIKAEIRRYKALRDTQSEALKTGDLGLLDRYPVLGAYKQQIERLGAAGQLDEFNPAQLEQLAATTGQQQSVASAQQQQAAALG